MWRAYHNNAYVQYTPLSWDIILPPFLKKVALAPLSIEHKNIPIAIYPTKQEIHCSEFETFKIEIKNNIQNGIYPIDETDISLSKDNFYLIYKYLSPEALRIIYESEREEFFNTLINTEQKNERFFRMLCEIILYLKDEGIIHELLKAEPLRSRFLIFLNDLQHSSTIDDKIKILIRVILDSEISFDTWTPYAIAGWIEKLIKSNEYYDFIIDNNINGERLRRMDKKMFNGSDGKIIENEMKHLY